MEKVKIAGGNIPPSVKAEVSAPSRTLPPEGFFMAVTEGFFSPEVLMDCVESGSPYRSYGVTDSTAMNIDRLVR